jgi:hypothetical protein
LTPVNFWNYVVNGHRAVVLPTVLTPVSISFYDVLAGHKDPFVWHFNVKS